MKKYIIGIAIFGILVAYSLGVRHEQPKIGAPTSLISNSPSTTASGSGTPPPDNTTPVAANTVTPSKSGAYRDGAYTGSAADAYYGNVQVKATISGGKITNVTFLQYPNTHATSVDINQQAMPYLQQEAIHAQSTNVQIVSGATYTSEAFIQSLKNALSQA